MNKKTVLDNGTRIVTESIPEFRSCTLGAWISTGSRFETEEDAGIAHFTEHLLFKGTTRRTAYDIAKEMDSIGGQLNAFTEKERTCFYARVLDQHVPIAVDIIFDMLGNSLLDPKEVEREKSVIMEEIKMIEDSPDDLAGHRFTRALWPGHAIGRPIIGYRESVQSMTSEKLRRFLTSRYGASNLMIAAAGQVDHDEFVELVQSHLKDYPAGDFLPEFDAPRPEGANQVFQKDCEQAYVCYGGRGPHTTDPRRYSFLVLDAVMGGSMSSRLFQEIREKRGLAYSVGTYQYTYTDVGLFAVHAGTSAQSVEELLGATDDILRGVIKDGLTPEELRRSKELLKGNLALGLESTSMRMLRLARGHLNHGRLIPVEEVLDAIERTTHDDVIGLAEEFFDPARFSFTALGPLDSVRGVTAQPVKGTDLRTQADLEEVMS
ncbi:MAG: pitrilysin family protein [Vulcanimicrobiota bacterium]